MEKLNLNEKPDKKDSLKLIILYYALPVIVLSITIFLVSRSFLMVFFSVPYILIASIFIGIFLFLSQIYISSFIELRNAKKAYQNTRNRIDFLKDNEIVCLEGTIEPEDKTNPLITPINQKKAVAYAYGNNFIGGGRAQTKTVIKPSGETIPINGIISLEFVPQTEEKLSLPEYSHFLEYLLNNKRSDVEKKDVQGAPLILNGFTNLIRKDYFSINEIIGRFSEKDFNKYFYKETYIPSNIYGWALGRWNDTDHQLEPLKASGCIYVVEKDYKKNFYKHMKELRIRYLIYGIGLALLTILPIIVSLTLVL